MKKMLVALATLTLIGTSVPALADGLTVSVEKATGLSSPETTLKVSVSGIPQDQGIYLMLCEGESANPRPANCSATHQAWLTMAASSLRMGAAAALPVNDFKIASSFSTRAGVAVDCTTSKCGVFVRRDHFGSADTTLDRFIPISFPAPKPAVSALIGNFENRVAVRFYGAAGQTATIKVGGRWVKVALTENNQLIALKTAGKSVPVQVFVDRVKVAQKNVKLG